ncbi:MAG: redoxin domain-containing protein [Prevotella sp.]|nr:redoxin domain-containing protein [Prevotella sp.]
MKKIVLTMWLFAFFCPIVLGQGKGSGSLCLRDEATGEWIIGLFDDFAVYDCACWQYESVSPKSVVLRNGDRRLVLRLTRKKDAVVGIAVGKEKHRVSEVTSPFLTDYPVADEQPFAEQRYEQDSIVLTAYMPELAGKEIQVAVSDVLLGKDPEPLQLPVDDRGVVTMVLPVIGPQEVNLSLDGSRLMAVMEPGNYFLFRRNGQTLVMGRASRLANETMAYFEDPAKERHEGWSKRFASYVDRINEIPSYFSNGRQGSDASESLLVMTPDVPLSLAGGFSSLKACIQAKQRPPYNIAKKIIYAITINPDEPDRKIYYNITRRMDLMGAMIADGVERPLTKRERASLERMDEVYEEEARVISGNLLDGDALQTWRDSLGKTIPYVEEGEQRINALDLTQPDHQGYVDEIAIRHILEYAHERGYPQVLCDAVVAQMLYDWLDHERLPLPKTLQRVLDTQMVNTTFKQKVLDAHSHYLALSKASFNEDVLKDNKVVEGLTDGKQILDRLVEPYRGRLVYIDFWGTWCGPCKANMRHMPEVHEALAGRDIVYLYLADNSPEDSWRNAIKEYGLDDANTVHYNLPIEQNEAVKQYVGLFQFPTYKLVNRRGELLPDDMPTPREIDRLKQKIEEIDAQE